MNNKGLGKLGEQIAADYLEKNGFTIIDRNFRPGKFGEIDIIASEKEFLCFIEVKTRTGSFFGQPIEAVNYEKRQKIKTLALIYIKAKRLFDANMRFDIVEVMGKRVNGEFVLKSINLVRSAY